MPWLVLPICARAKQTNEFEKVGELLTLRVLNFESFGELSSLHEVLEQRKAQPTRAKHTRTKQANQTNEFESVILGEQCGGEQGDMRVPLLAMSKPQQLLCVKVQACS